MLHFFNIFSEGGQVPEVLGPPGRGEQNHHQCGPRRGGGALHLQAWRLLLPELLFFPKHFGVDLTGIPKMAWKSIQELIPKNLCEP